MLSRHRRSKSSVVKDEKKEADQQQQQTSGASNSDEYPSNKSQQQEQQQQQQDERADDDMTMPAIYAAPTVDTLDDQSLFVANGRHRARGPLASAKSRQHNRDDESGVTRHVVSFTPTSIDASFSFNSNNNNSESQYSYHHTAHSPTKRENFADFASQQHEFQQQNTAATSRQQQQQQQTANQSLKATEKPRQRRKGKKQQKPRDFQHPEDAMTVTVRSVNIAQRAAFDTNRVASEAEWHMTARRLEQASTAAGASSSSSSSSNAQKKMSPSLQHLKLLHAMQSVSTIRQLAFSPSVGINSDVFVPWWEDALESNNNENNNSDDDDHGKAARAKLKRRMSSAALEQRDGRYRSIHPVQATVSALPSVPPSLSNKKSRLPMRSDVGFPNASQDEITQKQVEINHETEWEEASPRIIVLVTSDDLGTAVQENDHDPVILPDHWEWNGGGLQSMPWAGKDLLRAKELNALHFSKKSSILSKAVLATESKSGRISNNSSNMDSIKKKLLEPNRTSMLAPPLDASFSKTLGWRPRPFHDRPPGMEYLLCWPLDISFDVGNIEPLLCSLALYNLPTHGDGTGNGVYGKISEDFWFPAGDWEGKIEVLGSFLKMPTAKTTGNNMMAPIEEDVLESWNSRKQKAIFSYDPLAICGGKESVFYVLQIFKVANDDVSAIYHKGTNGPKANKRSNSVKNLFKGKPPTKQHSQESIDHEKVNANLFFDKYGTDFMTPLAYGVKPVTTQSTGQSHKNKNQNMEFPKGTVQDVTLYAASSAPESQEDFVGRLSKVSVSISSNGKVYDPAGMSRSSKSEHGLPTGSSLVRSEVGPDLTSVVSSVSDRSLPKSSSSLLGSSTPNNLKSKSGEAYTQGSSSPKQKKKSTSIAKRIPVWISPKKASRSLKGASSSSHPKPAPSSSTASARPKRNTTGHEEAIKDLDPHLAAAASIFSSTLSADWLQSMLSEPTDLDGFKLFPQPRPTGKTSVPKLLCDISGDFAVMLEHKGASSKKRSNLARLPSHNKPAGYVAASEIREVLFLPARPEKQHDLDIPPSYRSLVNLLYLYPRLLRSSDQQGENKQKKQESLARYTVRVRLVRSSLDVDGNKVASSNTPLEAFHSSSPWARSPLSKEVYTKVASGQPPPKHNKSGVQDAKIEQPMKDEFKLRLPLILDGTFFLQFTLYEITRDDNIDTAGVSVRAVGDNSIPLSSSSIRDAAGGIKVATVIPNGCHRLKLGDFRFYIESRLISSVHVGDAAVAAAMRDFPIAAVADEGGFPSKAVLSRFSPQESAVLPDSGISFPALFANASDGTVVGHFQLLLYSHLSNLVQEFPATADANYVGRGEFMMGNLQSLFGILRKVKKRLDPARLKVFMKIVFDEFDESFLVPKNRDGEIDDEQASDLGSEVELAKAITGSTAGEGGAIDEDDMGEDLVDEGAVRVRHKDSLRDGIERRLNRRKSVGIGFGDGASLSRVAYGASKTDRLKIEAELYYDGARFAHLYDDDETIMTSGTALHNISDLKQKQEAAAALERQQNGGQSGAFDKNKNLNDLYSDGSIRAATAAASRVIQNQSQDAAAKSQEGFATRVKTVANVILAPCVGNQGPAGSSPRRLSLDCGRSSRSRRRKSTGGATTRALSPATGKTSAETSKETFALPGSDDEDDSDLVEQTDLQKSMYSAFRGFRNGVVLNFSIESGRADQNGASLIVSGGKYVYESILFLWLRAWSDYNSKRGGTSEVPIFDSSATSNTLFGFFSNMDILLPLCLKSLAVRYQVEVQASNDLSTRANLDKKHMSIFLDFVEVLARSVMGQALTYSASSAVLESKNAALLQALASSELIVEWFEGLLAILHPEHVRSLIEKYFKTLNECETEHLKENPHGLLEFQWTEKSIHRVKSSRQLRLRAVEKLAVIPSFLALNFPLKFSDGLGSQSQLADTDDSDDIGISSWKMQYGENGHDSSSEGRTYQPYGQASGDDRRPESGWLARLLADEALSVCALSCEAVVAEAMAQIELSSEKKSDQKVDQSHKKRSGSQLERRDLLMFQSLAIHAVTTVYELVLRRNAMDRRFQTDACRGRIAALYAECLFTQSLKSVRWLARMESSHKVRSLWMLCLIYVLQEAPEVLIRSLVRSYCDPSDILIHRFIRLVRLASSTFQSFIDQPRHSTFPNEIDKGISPWLLQESFNTICATTNIVVEECVKLTESNPKEQRKMIHAVLDLFLHILTTPQSAVTHLRCLGGALQALEKFGVELFLDVVGNNLQHWIRVVQSLMNSTSLSVRSISVDFVVSLLGSAFDLLGSVDDILLVFVSVLPEVVAREIGLFSVDGHVSNAQDLEQSMWPLRRSFADLEDADPVDDDRIDPELFPVLKTFCRASQAVLDGVLIELRLKKHKCVVVGTRVEVTPLDKRTFDAEEECLLEAAEFFLPETAPMQRLRWLLTLKSLHEAKGQWVEAAECLIACANTISDAIPHLRYVWRPTRFPLWSDVRRSTWLSTVGEDMGHPARGNKEVMAFADGFLEPNDMLKKDDDARSASGTLQQPTVAAMCVMLSSVAKEAVQCYLREEGMDEVAYSRLENLLKTVMNVLGDHGSLGLNRGRSLRAMSASIRKRHVEEETALRRVTAAVSGDLTKLAERLLLLVQDEPGTPTNTSGQDERLEKDFPQQPHPFYVLVAISGAKPPRFLESTTLPTFLDFGVPCLCRVPQHVVDTARLATRGNSQVLHKHICLEYGKPLKNALSSEKSPESIVLCPDSKNGEAEKRDPSKTYIDITILHSEGMETQESSMPMPLESKRFFYRKPAPIDPVLGREESGNDLDITTPTKLLSTLVEVTVARTFPSALSRQRTLLTSEILSSTF